MSQLVPNQDLSFEEALGQLEATVAQLEEGRLPLAEAVAHYERGMGLAAYCSDLLDSAELRIREIDTATSVAPDDLAAVEDDDPDGDAEPEEYNLDKEIDRLLFDDGRR